MTRVGTVIVARIDRISIRNTDSAVARTIPGLAHMRSNIASWRIDRIDGNMHLADAPVPHPERVARPISWRRAICSVDGRYIRRPILTGLSYERSRTSAGSRSKSSQSVAMNG